MTVAGDTRLTPGLVRVPGVCPIEIAPWTTLHDREKIERMLDRLGLGWMVPDLKARPIRTLELFPQSRCQSMVAGVST